MAMQSGSKQNMGFEAVRPGDRERRAAGAMLGVSTVAMGLIAGVYYSFSCAVMPGLARTDARTFLQVMQRINVEIVNPAFMFSFFGGLVFTLIAAALQRRLGARSATRWIVFAAALYGVALLVTIFGNIPLNDELARTDVASQQAADLVELRRRFEGPWNAWNLVRALASTAALASLGRALVLHGREDGADRVAIS